MAGYLIIELFTSGHKSPQTLGESTRSLTIIVLLTAILSHFVEINFGIAIVSTRTYFWLYSGLVVVAGLILPIYNQYDFSSLPLPQSTERNSEQTRSGTQKYKRKKRGRSPSPTVSLNLTYLVEYVLPATLITTILVSTIGFDVITNPSGLRSSFAVLWASLSRLPNQNWAYSPGILLLILTILFISIILQIAEASLENNNLRWWKTFGLVLGGTIFLSLIFWIWHASSLVTIAANTATDLSGVLSQVHRYEWLLTRYFIFFFLLVIGLGAVLAPAASSVERTISIMGVSSALVLSVLVLLLVLFTNLRVVQADIVFKLAEPFTRSGQWPVAITIYNRANQLAPNEDYYYLFLGRAYLEQAKTLADGNERENLIKQAESDLHKSQTINPLNTDHTANLARLYSLWASFTQDTQDRIAKGKISSDYFARALQMSPQSARLWDEWALLDLNIQQNPDEAMPKLERSLEIDPEYHWTYGMIGDLSLRRSRQANDPTEMQNALLNAVTNYNKAIELTPLNDVKSKLGYQLGLAGAYVQMGEYVSAIRVYSDSLVTAPASLDKWRIEEVIANLYLEISDIENALTHLQKALELAPEEQKTSIQAQIDQIQQSQP